MAAGEGENGTSTISIISCDFFFVVVGNLISCAGISVYKLFDFQL